MVNVLRTSTGSRPRAMSRSAAQPAASATAAIPAKLKKEYSPMRCRLRPRCSTR